MTPYGVQGSGPTGRKEIVKDLKRPRGDCEPISTLPYVAVNVTKKLLIVIFDDKYRYM